MARNRIGRGTLRASQWAARELNNHLYSALSAYCHSTRGSWREGRRGARRVEIGAVEAQHAQRPRGAHGGATRTAPQQRTLAEEIGGLVHGACAPTVQLHHGVAWAQAAGSAARWRHSPLFEHP